MKITFTFVFTFLAVSSFLTPVQAQNVTDDLMFIHHSVGANWLSSGMESAVIAKSYIDERNDLYYGSTITQDSGRPNSLAPTPGDQTDMQHWILWFNDYLTHVKSHQSASGVNRIIMFKTCYPGSNISSDGSEPGDPFSSTQTLANYRAIFRHPSGAGRTYSRNGYTYSALEDVFARNPDTLFIFVTSPPRNYAPGDATNDAEASRARTFSTWVKQTWLSSYNSAHPSLHNVAVFDFFDVLAYPSNHATHPNRLRAEYGGTSGDSHPNTAGNQAATVVFATGATNLLDSSWNSFINHGTSLAAPTRLRLLGQ